MLDTMVEHVIGIDPDRDRVTAAVVDTATTGEQASGVFGTTRSGYDRLLKWAEEHTQTADRVWSVEGSGSYGAGVTGYLMGLSNRLCEGVSSYVKLGAVFGGWRWVQMRSEIRRLRTRIASLWVFPRVMSFW